MDYESFQRLMKNHDFDESELKLLNDVMRGCIIPQNKQKNQRKLYSFRLNENDMIKLKSMAEEEWIPYQTLVGSIVHKYVTGN